MITRPLTSPVQAVVLAMIFCCAVVSGCDRQSSSGPTAPTPPAPGPTPLPPPPPTYPSITVGEVVRFRFTRDDYPCVGGTVVCRSYLLMPATSGWLEVVLTSVSGDASFVSVSEMYVVPGGDSWTVGPGPRISVLLQVDAGLPYEIRMVSFKVPSIELKLTTSLK